MEAVLSEKTDEEVAQLKTVYQKNCRVMKSVGDFAYVISLQLPEQNVQLKFLLTESVKTYIVKYGDENDTSGNQASYPQVIPGIVTLSPDLYPESLAELNAFLVREANQSIGKPMIQDLVKEGISWLETNLVARTPSFEKKNTEKSSRAKNKSKPEKTDINAEKHSKKKPSMRTAVDVISRIQWDKSLSMEDFFVGYLDRFTGIEEKPFTVFSWEDIASVDYNTLAIPKHRICYFKYKTVKVWDKAQRLDLVFGSTGDTICLADVMANYEKMANFQVESLSDPDNALSCESLASSLPDENPDNVLSRESLACFKCFDKKPNFFIGLRIDDELVRQRVAKLQDSVLQLEPAYEEHCIGPSLLHVTLCALSLETPDQIVAAAKILKSAKPEISKLVAFASPLHIADVKCFSKRVLFGEVETTPQLLQLVDLLKSRFESKGFLHRDHYKAFNPHMTLFNISPTGVWRSVGMTNRQIFEHYGGYKFGKQYLDNLHLCAMDKDIREEDGFYKCAASILL